MSDTADLVIITPLVEEYEAVVAQLRDPTLIRATWPTTYGRIGRYSAAVCFPRAATNTASADFTRQAVARWAPRWVVAAGVAGGFTRQNVSLGDVVFGTEVYDVEYGKVDLVRDDSGEAVATRFTRRHQFDSRPDPAWVAHAEVVARQRGQQSWTHRLRGTRPDRSRRRPQVHLGPIASANKVVDDVGHQWWRDAFAGLAPAPLGIEMEAAGVGVALERLRSEGPAPTYFTVRGICDLPDAPKLRILGQGQRDAWKVNAARAAAAFLTELLSYPGAPEPAVRSTPQPGASDSPTVRPLPSNLPADSPSDTHPTQVQFDDAVAAAVRTWPLKTIATTDPFDTHVGVFYSRIAERYQGQRKRPPYVERSRDPSLTTAILENGFALIIGPSKSGKTRMAFEACLRLLPQRFLVIPRDAASIPELTQLLMRDTQERGFVLWLDDFERYLVERGLTADILDTLRAQSSRRVVGLGTIRSEQHQRFIEMPGEIGKAQRAVLDWATRHHAEVRISTTNTKYEGRQVERLYPGVDLSIGLPRYLTATAAMVTKFHNAEGKPEFALISAAIDWFRAGAEWPISRVQLMDLTKQYSLTQGILPPDRKQFNRALAWAQQPVESSARMLAGAGDDRTPGFRVFEFMLSYVDQSDHDIGEVGVPEATWAFVIQHVRPEGALSVGFAAVQRGNLRAAIRAWTAAEDAPRTIAAPALLNKAVALGELGYLDEEIATYDQYVTLFPDAPDATKAEILAAAYVYKGQTLMRRGCPDQALVALEDCLTRFEKRTDTGVAEQVATALVYRGVTLLRLGRAEEALSALEGFLTRDRAGYGMVGEGAETPAMRITLGVLDIPEGLSSSEDILSRFETRSESRAAFALANKGLALIALGRDREALSTFDDFLRHFGTATDTGVIEEVVAVLVNKGTLLMNLGRPKQALAAFEDGLTRLRKSADVALVEQLLPMVVGYKAEALEQLGRQSDAIDVVDDFLSR